MRNHILTYINGQKHLVKGGDVFLTVSEFLRRKLKLCGTKIVCSEGDCGSCSVLCGRIHASGAPIQYRTIDSCIRFMFQLDGCHVITVEGVAKDSTKKKLAQEPSNEHLSEVQQAMVDCHGSQCGFCTPGFVIAMTGVLEKQACSTIEDWRHELTGNLCRCTGYSSIIDAAMKAIKGPSQPMSQRYPETEMVETVRVCDEDSLEIEAEDKHGVKQTVACPRSIDDAVDFLTIHPDCKIVAGGTDVGVQFNKGSLSPQTWLDLSRVCELSNLKITDDSIEAGACVTWADLEKSVEKAVPEFHKIVSVFGSPQIRHVGTIGGNIINASPIADSIPFLFVCDAELELTSKTGTRNVNINDFYRGYKEFDLNEGELLTNVRIPLPPVSKRLGLYKVSRRKDMDISTFTAAISIERDEKNAISQARLAYGAVGPVVLRLHQTEAFLKGRTFSLETMTAAGKIAIEEITPITDVRGGREFRLQLAQNVLMKFYHESETEGAIA